MEKLTDTEVLTRLIYRAYIAPDPHAPLEAEALLPFQAALELYARTWRAEALRNEQPRILPADLYPWPARGCASADDRPDGADCCGDSCPVELPEDPPEEAAPPLREKDLDGFQPVNVKLKGADTHTHTAGATDGGGGKPAAFAGKGAEEKAPDLRTPERLRRRPRAGHAPPAGRAQQRRADGGGAAGHDRRASGAAGQVADRRGVHG